MRDSFQTRARDFAPGIGEAVAKRTILRKGIDGRLEQWPDVAYRVALGNALLTPKGQPMMEEFHDAHHHLRQASILSSGRHLQHGDSSQPTRNIEVFTNCATGAASFIDFYLLLNGSGVGRAYDDKMMLVDWRNMPKVVPVISSTHPDVMSGEISALNFAQAEHFYKGLADKIHYYEVPDSREGWAHAVEMLEVMTFEGAHRDSILFLDFSKVRHRGSPIAGMQNRPASGPGPLMNAIYAVSHLRDSGMKPWRATMFVDHYMAECVLVGGARRAARMATKFWRDEDIFEFVELKRGGFLWSSNNSVTVDQDFWDAVKDTENPEHDYATRLLQAITSAAYHDGTGEPGIINQDKLSHNPKGMECYAAGVVAESKKFKPMARTAALFEQLVDRACNSGLYMITNPCGEIALFMLGGYCVIGDVVPFHAQSDADAIDAFRVMTRMLMRTNLMDALYGREVRRTNRIGVSMTGIHEYAWARFGFGWKDLVDEDRSRPFWEMLSRFNAAVRHEAERYAKVLGVEVPHTMTTIKPAGTTSKLFGLTEGAHLPSMREYLRWVQFRNDDPLVEQYRAKGYPVRKLQSYSGTTIVGFPTAPTICTLDMDDKLVTAPEATPEEQYQWLRLLEKWWIKGADRENRGNQVSYTLKFDRSKVSYEDFYRTLVENQGTIKCCSVMPMLSEDESKYEYLPEEAVTKEHYERISAEIRGETVQEDVGLEHVDCSSGACPINFGENSASA